MSAYEGRHGEIYDLLYADKPYASEAEFVDRLIRRHSDERARTILELACGTGSHALELAKRGYVVTATDVSETLLAQAREKQKSTELSVTVAWQDMTTLDVRGRPFDAAMCLFDSIGYVLTNESLTEVFAGVREHLRDNGLFIIEFWHASAMLRGYQPVRLRRVRTDTGEILRLSETILDIEQQTATVRYSILEPANGDLVSIEMETQRNRFFLIQEMKALGRSNGFLPLAWHAGYSDDEAIDLDTWHVVAVMKKTKATA